MRGEGAQEGSDKEAKFSHIEVAPRGAYGPCLANENLQRFPLTSAETSDGG